ncbi:MAG: dephospho-CoA kinase [Lachnospiraceae bacterium]|nr:dephospho-CoA kinase [Lachnospiraceae bacterium]
MRSIGITGGVGAGKSTVLSYLEKEYHAYLVVADELAKELEQPGHACYDELVKAFGTEILTAEGLLDKKAFAALIFSDESALQRANGIIHPAVKADILRQMQEQNDAGTEIFVVEAALLIEENYDKILDELWYIYAEESVRMKRLADSRGYTEEKSRSIMRQQKTDAEFRSCCRYIIDNSGGSWETQAQIDAILKGTR